ncbi:MAG: AMP-binding protein [Novosphingobium sp.]|nr:AMP-binding protein [Novosphingobium sp.]MCP5403398.1 AMP-binding protein [Novosphingobium sp.]
MDAAARKRTWIDLFEDLEREHPDVTALSLSGDGGETLSWRDLVRRSAGVSRLFADRGVKQGDVVCIQLPNSIAFVLSVIAAWRLGATVAPLRWDLPAPERAQLVALASPAVSVTQSGSGEGEVSQADVAAALPVDPATLPPSLPAVPAWMTASGGSTGSPKLIAPDVSTAVGEGGMPMAGGASRFSDNTDHRHPVHMVCTPLYHMHGFSLLWRTLTEDFRVVVMPHFETEAFLDLIESERVSFIAIVPTMVVRLVKSPSFRGRDFSSLETVIFGAGATPEWAIREWIEVVGGESLLLGYGMSESIAASFITGTEWLEHPGSVGKPFDVETMVADDDGKPLPPGEVGEVFFRPEGGREQTFRYVGDAKARMLPGGWASVGDLGKLDKDGYLYIMDRRTDMVKTGGANVFVSEVEAALLAHADVADVAVVGLSDPEWGRRVHAIVVLQSGADANEAADRLRSHCKDLLAAYKAPRSFEFVDTLGRTDAGKLNRQALARAREEENA